MGVQRIAPNEPEVGIYRKVRDVVLNGTRRAHAPLSSDLNTTRACFLPSGNGKA
jgi:hypothetical protein